MDCSGATQFPEIYFPLLRIQIFVHDAAFFALKECVCMPISPAQLPRTPEDVLHTSHFFSQVLPLYEKGVGDIELEADLDTARSAIPAASGGPRDFSFIAPEIPEFIPENCVGCMDCVTECPDTAILGKVLPKASLEQKLGGLAPEAKAEVEGDWAKT